MGRIKVRNVLIILMLIVIVFTIGCSKKETETMNKVEAYTMAIDKLYKEDVALNVGIKYIAIDTSTIINLNDEEKEDLVNELKAYEFEILEMGMEELKENGYIENLSFKNGILFEITNDSMEGDRITLDISKWRSGLGAIGYDDMVVSYEDEEWKIEEEGTAWIS